MRKSADQQLRSEIGQLLIIGVRGESLDQQQIKVFNDLRPGGVVLFRRNFSSTEGLKELNKSIKNNFEIRPFIAVDQEGGAVTRIETMPRLPSPRSWAQRANQKLTEDLGYELGRILVGLGINMNLAPVLDVSEPSSFLKTRSYSSSPEVASRLGVAFSRGLLRAGVLPTAKHFPGLGQVVGDPHLKQVQITATEDVLQKKDLVPFQSFSKISNSAVMLSHSTYPGLDDSGLSATYSKRIVSDLLRAKMNYQGLIVTDDLLMTGADSNLEFGDRVVSALKAGSDMLMIAWSETKQRRAFTAIYEAVRTGKLSRNEVRVKYSRIQRVKNSLLAFEKSRQPATDPESQFKKIVTSVYPVKAQLRPEDERSRAEHSAKIRRPESLQPNELPVASDAR